MGKQLLPKGALEHAALAEIRSCYGCEDVIGVEIELVLDERFDENWRIAAVQRPKSTARSSPAELLATTRAVAAVQSKMREAYNVDTAAARTKDLAPLATHRNVKEAADRHH